MTDSKQTNSSSNLEAGKLIVANTHMEYDPTYAEAVILILAHDDRGSMGVVINKSIDQVPYQAVKDGLGFDIYAGKDESEKKAYLGGPMTPESSVFILHDNKTGPDNSRQVGTSDICVSADMKALEAKLPENVRVCLGYSGWGQDQLESEMVMFQSWKVIDADVDLIFNTPVNDIYKEASKRAGIDPNAPIPKPPEHKL